MSYNKHTWATGDTITAQLLNNLESGVEDASEIVGDFIVNLTPTENEQGEEQTFEADQSFEDIYQAAAGGQNVLLNVYVNDMYFKFPLMAAYMDESDDPNESVSYTMIACLNPGENILLIQSDFDHECWYLEEISFKGVPTIQEPSDYDKVLTATDHGPRWEARGLPSASQLLDDYTIVSDDNQWTTQPLKITYRINQSNTTITPTFSGLYAERSQIRYSLNEDKSVVLHYQYNSYDSYTYMGIDEIGNIYRVSCIYDSPNAHVEKIGCIQEAPITVSGTWGLNDTGDAPSNNSMLAATFTTNYTIQQLKNVLQRQGTLDIRGALVQDASQENGMIGYAPLRCICGYVANAATVAQLVQLIGIQDYKSGTEGIAIKVMPANYRWDTDPKDGNDKRVIAVCIYETTNNTVACVTTAAI